MKRQWFVISRQWLVLAVVLALATAALAQIGSLDTPVKAKSYVVYAAEPQVVAAGKPGVVQLRFHVVEGFHVNSHTPKSELLIPTSVKLDAADGVKAGAVEYPPGKLFSFGF